MIREGIDAQRSLERSVHMGGDEGDSMLKGLMAFSANCHVTQMGT